MKKILIKILLCILAVIMAVIVTVSCQTKEDSGKYSIVCTIFPEYDFITNIIGDKSELFDVTMLLGNGSDMHSYQPTVADIAKISDCDLFVYVGSQSQNWVNNVLKNVDTSKTKVISLAEILENELCGDCTAVEDEEHNHEHDHQDSYDEHVWLSLRKSQKIIDALCSEISKLDPENQRVYESNSENYNSSLSMLDSEFQSSLETAKQNTLIFADRFPFIYLTKDYGIEYFAAFTGCSTETDAGVKTILSLSEKLKELELPSLMVLETSDKTIANTVISQSGLDDVKLFTLNSCQLITKKQIEEGTTYIDIMKTNLDNIKTALGCEG